MSQRLLIVDEKPKECRGYDAVVTNKDTSHEVELTLKYDFFASDEIYYLGPWKIRIEDLEVYLRMEPILIETFEHFDLKYPGAVWTFYYKDKTIDHPTKEELLQFLWGDYEPEQSE